MSSEALDLFESDSWKEEKKLLSAETALRLIDITHATLLSLKKRVRLRVVSHLVGLAGLNPPGLILPYVIYIKYTTLLASLLYIYVFKLLVLIPKLQYITA